MDKETAWDVYFSSICSLRFHPRNEIESYVKEVEFAATIADLMLSEKEKRWPGQR